MSKPKPFTEVLRAAVLNAGETRYKICQATGVSQGNLSRFVNGKSGLSLDSVDRLCEYLQLRLVGPAKRK